MKRPVIEVEFQDQGQDFLTWTLKPIKHDYEVVDCKPFQRRFWVGCIVYGPAHIKPGCHLQFFKPESSTPYNIRYPVIAIRELDGEELSHVTA